MLLLACLMLSAHPIQEPREAVAEVLDSLHLAAAMADSDDYFDCFAEDAVFLGTDAGERWTIPQFRAYAGPFFDKGQGWTYLSTQRHIRLSTAGDTAWFDERLQNEKYGEVRGSGVLEATGGTWKITQYNLSFPVLNDGAEALVKRTKNQQHAGQPRGSDMLVRDGERTLFAWNKVGPPQLKLDPAERPVVILLPSASFSARALWDFPLRDYSVMNAMAARGWDVFAVELGGYGLSSPPQDRPAGGCESAVRDLGLMVESIAKRRGVEKVTVIGSSWGAQVAARYASQHPDRVRALVLHGHRWQSRFEEGLVRQIFGDGVFNSPVRTINAEFATSDFIPGLFEEDVPEAFTRFLLSQGDRVPSGPLRDYVHGLPLADPATIVVPTLMMYGRSEFAGAEGELHRQEQRGFFEALAGPKHWIEVPGAGHSAHLDRPHRLVQGCLIGWLERCEDED
ncbi:MAG: pimeloyl-ACP methyl ester carboxylesterase [Candidatus Paceibacteria bacterium]|jgi:pimeloyl-ACP methyl ester carboxylesterase